MNSPLRLYRDDHLVTLRSNSDLSEDSPTVGRRVARGQMVLADRRRLRDLGGLDVGGHPPRTSSTREVLHCIEPLSKSKLRRCKRSMPIESNRQILVVSKLRIVKPILERNSQIVRIRKDGVPTKVVARKFRLSRSRIQQIEHRAAEDASLANRRAALWAQMRAADDPEKLWPLQDLMDASISSRLTKIRLLKHFARTEQTQISLREWLDMCLPPPRNSEVSMLPPLLRIVGIGKKCFWSVADGLTNTDLGNRCNEEWQSRLIRLKQQWGMPT